MADFREYVVTAKSYEVVDDLCNDIENPGGDLYIPNRAVEIANPRPISLNTHYYLTDDEAELLKNDSRVAHVTLLPADLDLRVEPLYTQTSIYWDKSTVSYRNSHRNWGLYRCTLSQNVQGWGSDVTPATPGGINILATGKDVDVIICDGHIDPTHPEFATDSEPPGTRVIQYNWFQNNPDVNGRPASNYIYPPYVDTSDRTSDNDHGCHVAGTACGNTQGWARDANIYNLNPYSTNINSGLSITDLIDYIRIFHRKKEINPKTGKKNPTIVNMSWGFSSLKPLSSVLSINYRGTVYEGPFTSSQAWSYGLANFNIGGQYYYYVCARYFPLDMDIANAMDEGVIFVGAAGNNYSKIAANDSDPDWDNYIKLGPLAYLNYHQGMTPSAGPGDVLQSYPGVICVGAVSSLESQYKARFSNTGPRIDVFAPGQNIMSSVNSNPGSSGTYDYRDVFHYVTKYSGTSMASPQVTGILACALEVYPTWNQYSARDYIVLLSKSNQLGDDISVPEYSNFAFLQGAPNRFLYFKQENQDSGMIFPKVNSGPQRASGQLYPRPRIYSYGTQIAV